jgi:predicted transcriptional regulator
MSTFGTQSFGDSMLDSLITSKTRQKLLVKFFSNPKTLGHLRGLAEEFGESTNSIRKELNHLAEAGLLTKSEQKNRFDYQANPVHPYFTNLQDLIQKYLGMDKLILAVLERMGEVHEIALVGDYARGIDSGTVEVQLTGNNLNESYLGHLSTKLKALIDKNVVFQVRTSITDPEALVLYTLAN